VVVVVCPLADGHLLDHVGLAGGTSATGANATTGLLLEDLPELERLVGSYVFRELMFNRTVEYHKCLPAVASI
jgi:hypothetical protein